MYAILKHGGHQYRVAPGDRLLVDRLVAEVGSRVTLEPVLLVGDGDSAEVGTGAVPGAHVVATVVAHRRGRKLRVFTYKPKKRHRRTLGYRSQLTELLVDEVAGASGRAERRAEQPAAEDAGRTRRRRAEPAAQAAGAPVEASETTPDTVAAAAGGAADAAEPEHAAGGGATAAAAEAEDQQESEPSAQRRGRGRRKSNGA